MVYNITMPRRAPELVTNEIYHVYNRGVEKRDVFLTDRDYKHFLETLEHYLAPVIKLSRKPKLKDNQRSETPLVDILCYCLMPNHFHLILRQKSDNGISVFMNRVANSFTKYFNIKNDRVGPLFQGVFKAVRIETDEQLLHVSRYIHLNPLVANLAANIRDYQWSSYSAYVGDEQNNLVSTQEVLAHFPSKEKYGQFVADQTDYARTLEQLKYQRLE